MFWRLAKKLMRFVCADNATTPEIAQIANIRCFFHAHPHLSLADTPKLWVRNRNTCKSKFACSVPFKA